ncbi:MULTISPECIES: hypothetical protein [Pseudomonas syringae group]|uniref:Uncharacterized protein n=3 Tax=Pseudomonas syringae group TaxID=136849 RepID=A0A3M3KRX6_PSECA|nr:MULTISPECIES: hypothetical protein [Pseudomonas syringae group]KPW22440.1 Uncharacterized protein ALO83_03724 [Pseudomonas cannabina pv. alisalensis]MBM0137469.1 hypothetical protein [Pseudomonas cannabina pv. alisalensis]QQN21050.1 hypothetical protein JGS08_20995 [Pseudomonas cannabina pv. alisalensis]RMN25461.1 hypothetical protein ALQ64_01146 [Pseudomonas cannabina]RMN77992.1 hypothetical protein ALQ52_02962 [Pseudomonas cannabina pv. alisalensis]
MKVITRRCMAAVGIITVLAVYAAGAYRNELSRQNPAVASCTFGHCVPTDATFSALR